MYLRAGEGGSASQPGIQMKWRLPFAPWGVSRGRKASQSRTGLSNLETFPRDTRGRLVIEKGSTFSLRYNQQGCGWVQGSGLHRGADAPFLRPQLRLGAAQEFYCPGRGEKREGEGEGVEEGQGGSRLVRAGHTSVAAIWYLLGKEGSARHFKSGVRQHWQGTGLCPPTPSSAEVHPPAHVPLWMLNY